MAGLVAHRQAPKISLAQFQFSEEPSCRSGAGFRDCGRVRALGLGWPARGRGGNNTLVQGRKSQPEEAPYVQGAAIGRDGVEVAKKLRILDLIDDGAEPKASVVGHLFLPLAGNSAHGARR